MTSQKPTGNAAGFCEGGYVMYQYGCYSIPDFPRRDNPHIRDLRRQAEILLERAENAQDWDVYRRHFNIYLALLDVEFRGAI